MESARETEGEGEAKNKPWSASQSRSHRGEEAQCVCLCGCVFKREKQQGWEAYIVKTEGLVTADWFSLGWGILWGRDEERMQRSEREKARDEKSV